MSTWNLLSGQLARSLEFQLPVVYVHVVPPMQASCFVFCFSALHTALVTSRAKTNMSSDKATQSSQEKHQRQRRVKSPNGTHPQPGCILFSVSVWAGSGVQHFIISVECINIMYGTSWGARLIEYHISVQRERFILSFSCK